MNDDVIRHIFRRNKWDLLAYCLRYLELQQRAFCVSSGTYMPIIIEKYDKIGFGLNSRHRIYLREHIQEFGKLFLNFHSITSFLNRTCHVLSSFSVILLVSHCSKCFENILSIYSPWVYDSVFRPFVSTIIYCADCDRLFFICRGRYAALLEPLQGGICLSQLLCSVI